MEGNKAQQADRLYTLLRRFSARQLFKYTMINVPSVVLGCGWIYGVAFLTSRIGNYNRRHIENDGFFRYKYRYIVVRPDNPYIQWFHQEDDKEMMAVFEADQVPYPNKYNDFKSMPVSGTPLHEKEHRSVPLLESLFGIGKKISIYGPHVV